MILKMLIFSIFADYFTPSEMQRKLMKLQSKIQI